MLSNHSGDITTRHQSSWSPDFKSSCLIHINLSSLIHIFILPLCCINVWKVKTFESFFLIKKVLSFEVSLPPHRVEGHRPHRQQTPVPIPHVSEVESVNKIQIFQYLKLKSFNRPYLGY